MKLAYIATDQSAVKNVSVIHAQNFNTIHFYLSHKNTIEECPSVENLDILANNLNINAQENAQT